MATALEREVYSCRDCRLWNDGVGYPEGEEVMVYWIYNGMTLSWPTGSVPLSSEVVPCERHRLLLDNAAESA